MSKYVAERARINASAPREHALAREILRLDWYDVESQARRVIEWLVTQELFDQAVQPECSICRQRHGRWIEHTCE